DTVSIIDLRARRTIDTVRVGVGPDGVAADAAAGKLYVCDESPHTISVVALPPGER
ncbi:MAG: YncE family protein, partial [Chloroflexi bacterium]|nr:YncE family protein [Chloroflexota bacterium]